MNIIYFVNCIFIANYAYLCSQHKTPTLKIRVDDDKIYNKNNTIGYHWIHLIMDPVF